MPLLGAALFVLPLLGSALASSLPTIEPRPLTFREASAAITPIRLQLEPIRFQTPAIPESRDAMQTPPVVTVTAQHEQQAPARPTTMNLNMEAPAENASERIDIGWRREALREAYSHLGTIYRWGGEEPNGFDCSGFVKYVMEARGFELPRTARAMFQTIPRIAAGELRPGDLVFFRGPDHVGIYAGSGQFIHASSGSRQVTISSLDQNSYRRRYIGAGRIAE
jgi:cell wall-associated NlpC family hydrolase